MSVRSFSQSWWRRVLLILGGLLVLTVGIVVFENWRARRAWEQYRATLTAQGESLDLADFLPGKVPDAENFAATPLLAPLRRYHLDPAAKMYVWDDQEAVAKVQALFDWIDRRGTANPGWEEGVFIDLTAYLSDDPAETNRAAAAAILLARLAADRTALDELREAARRPYAVFGPGDQSISSDLFLAQLSVIKQIARAFRVRALARLAAGGTDGALEDIETILALGRSLRAEPVLLATLVRLAIAEAAIQPVWEGLARRAWNEDQLRRLQAMLDAGNLVADGLRGLRAERAYSLGIMAGWIDGTGPDPAFNLPNAWVLPKAMLYRNQLLLARIFQEHVLPLFDPERGVVDLAACAAYLEQRPKLFKGFPPYRVLAQMWLPAFDSVPRTVVKIQTHRVLARVACALEREKRATGGYPAALATLAPKWLATLPLDPAGGGTLHYQRLAPDRFRLYSVGLNRRDDGGQTTPAREPGQTGPTQPADWVWPAPTGAGLREGAVPPGP